MIQTPPRAWPSPPDMPNVRSAKAYVPTLQHMLSGLEKAWNTTEAVFYLDQINAVTKQMKEVIDGNQARNSSEDPRDAGRDPG